MLDNFEEFTTAVSPDINIYGRKAGTGPPLLLLHGFPENHRMWASVASQLTASFTLVIPDLRGYGQSSHPPGDAAHATYSKRAMAGDMVALMKAHGHEQFFLCGHDRGGRVAHRLAADHPAAVRKLMVLDIAPTLAMYETTDFRFASAYFHWFFLIQEKPMPEDLITANPDAFFQRTLKWGIFDPQGPTAQSYRAQLAAWDTCHAMCEDYRAGATIDLEHAREDIKNGVKVQCPIRCLWGKRGVVEVLFKPLELWKDVCASTVDGEAVNSGHFIPEELPEETVRHIKDFFV